MISQTEAAHQMERLSGLDFYPREDGGKKELLSALQAAKTVEVAARAVTTWLEGQRECPKPADMRRLIWERQGEAEKVPVCQCGGSGWLTIYRLVTYKGRSLTIDHSEPLNLDFEERLALREKLGENQEILSGAAACSCLPSTHHALTGEHR